MSLSKAKTLGHTEITNLHLHCQCGSEVPAKKSLFIHSQKKKEEEIHLRDPSVPWYIMKGEIFEPPLAEISHFSFQR